MSRARHKEHKERADGGRLSSEPKWNAGEEQNAAKEAMEKKKGGRVRHHEAEGEESKKRMDKRARGGRTMNKPETGAMSRKEPEDSKEKSNPEELKHGGSAHKRKERAQGGRIGSDKMPLSSAARVKHVTKGEDPEEGIPSD